MSNLPFLFEKATQRRFAAAPRRSLMKSVVKAFLFGISATFLLTGFSPASFAKTFAWTRYGVTGTLTPGDLCTTDGIYCTTALSSITGTPGGVSGQIQYNNGGAFAGANNFVWDNNANFLGLGTATASAQLHMSGANAVSAPAWTTNGIGIRQDGQTYTDSSSSGTVGSNYVDVIGQPTLAASSATTYTNAATMVIQGPPAAGSNVTIANPASLVVASGNVGVGSASPQQPLDVAGPVKVSGSGSETCDAAHVGSIRFDPATISLQLCFVH